MFEQMAELFTNLPGGVFLWSTLVFVFVVSVLVFIHEMGHYLAARSVGVYVEVFSIGFGREIFGWYDKQGTRWKVSLLPLGGYVKMYGMTGETQPNDVPEDRQHEAFVLKSVLRRMWVVFAGPFANFLLAFVLLAGLFYFVGEQRVLATVGSLTPDMPAVEAGLDVGDEIRTVNGQAITYWDELPTLIQEQEGGAVEIGVTQPGETALRLFMITPVKAEVKTVLGETKTVYQIGVRAGNAYTRVSHGFGSSLVLGAKRTYQQTALILQAVWRMISGQMRADIGGPLTIGKVAGEQATMGVESLFLFMAFISINLGLINLFPVPVLDGGHLVYFAIEGLLGRPLTEKVQDVGNRLGMTLIMLLMVFAFYKDIINIVMPIFES